MVLIVLMAIWLKNDHISLIGLIDIWLKQDHDPYWLNGHSVKNHQCLNYSMAIGIKNNQFPFLLNSHRVLKQLIFLFVLMAVWLKNDHISLIVLMAIGLQQGHFRVLFNGHKVQNDRLPYWFDGNRVQLFPNVFMVIRFKHEQFFLVSLFGLNVISLLLV